MPAAAALSIQTAGSGGGPSSPSARSRSPNPGSPRAATGGSRRRGLSPRPPQLPAIAGSSPATGSSPANAAADEASSHAGDEVPEEHENENEGEYDFPEDYRSIVGSNFAHSASAAGPSSPVSGKPARANALLDFIDECSDGISDYLACIEEQRKGVVYDRHERQEWRRWFEKVRLIHKHAHRVRIEEMLGETIDNLGLGGTTPAAAAAEGRTAWPCAPPEDVYFEQPLTLPDGRKRLAFSACFECGNLAFASAETTSLYTLLLDFDYNTKGYTQWFYFAVRGGTPGLRVTFRIINMSKGHSLFAADHGMRPVVWSTKAGRGWERGCSDVSYYANEYKREGGQGERKSHYFTLEFAYKFEHEDDTVFFAYHYPYTYSHLQDFLTQLLRQPSVAAFARRGELCRTIGGLVCDTLEIGAPFGDDAASAMEAEEGAESATSSAALPGDGAGSEPLDGEAYVKPLVVATARVHPGESNCSWMMQGFLHFLCSSAPEARALREAYRWLVVPMLNPDGVIQGNYRCGLAGADLNRVFSQPHKKLNPTVWHLKQRLLNQRVEAFIDFHGHSKREGIFMYGGNNTGEDRDEKNALVKLVPRLCALASGDFKFYRCVFAVQESKLSTGRLVAFRQLGVQHAYTVEASFLGAGPGKEEAEEAEAAAGAAQPRVPPSARQTQADEPEELASSRQGSLSSIEYHTAGGEDPTSPGREAGSESDESAAFQSGASRGGSSCEPAEVVATEDAQPRRRRSSRAHNPPNQFTPARLELAGHAILRALCATLQFSKGLRLPEDDGVLHGRADEVAVMSRSWPHLHFEQLTQATVEQEFRRLLARQEDVRGIDFPWGTSSLSEAKLRAAAEGEDMGSDSDPEHDQKRPDELASSHRRILVRLRRRRPKVEKRQPAPPPAPKETQQFKKVIAFGTIMRLPLISRQLAAPVRRKTITMSSPSAISGGTEPSSSKLLETGDTEAYSDIPPMDTGSTMTVNLNRKPIQADAGRDAASSSTSTDLALEPPAASEAFGRGVSSDADEAQYEPRVVIRKCSVEDVLRRQSTYNEVLASQGRGGDLPAADGEDESEWHSKPPERQAAEPVEHRESRQEREPLPPRPATRPAPVETRAPAETRSPVATVATPAVPKDFPDVHVQEHEEPPKRGMVEVRGTRPPMIEPRTTVQHLELSDEYVQDLARSPSRTSPATDASMRASAAGRGRRATVTGAALSPAQSPVPPNPKPSSPVVALPPGPNTSSPVRRKSMGQALHRVPIERAATSGLATSQPQTDPLGGPQARPVAPTQVPAGGGDGPQAPYPEPGKGVSRQSDEGADGATTTPVPEASRRAAPAKSESPPLLLESAASDEEVSAVAARPPPGSTQHASAPAGRAATAAIETAPGAPHSVFIATSPRWALPASQPRTSNLKALLERSGAESARRSTNSDSTETIATHSAPAVSAATSAREAQRTLAGTVAQTAAAATVAGDAKGQRSRSMGGAGGALVAAARAQAASAAPPSSTLDGGLRARSSTPSGSSATVLPPPSRLGGVDYSALGLGVPGSGAANRLAPPNPRRTGERRRTPRGGDAAVRAARAQIWQHLVA